VEEERKEIGGPTGKKTRERKIEMSKQMIAIKTEEYNPKEVTYFGKGAVTTEWLHAGGGRDVIVLAKGSEAADKFL
jgi:hypothetical protein